MVLSVGGQQTALLSLRASPLFASGLSPVPCTLYHCIPYRSTPASLPSVSHRDITSSLIFYSAALNAPTHGPLHSCRLVLGTTAPQSPAAARGQPILPLACSLPVPRAPNRAEPQDRESCCEGATGGVRPPRCEFLRSSASAPLRPTHSDHAQRPPPHASHTKRASWSGESGSK